VIAKKLKYCHIEVWTQVLQSVLFGWAVRAHGVLWAELSARRGDCVCLVERGDEEEELGRVLIYKERAV